MEKTAILQALEDKVSETVISLKQSEELDRASQDSRSVLYNTGVTDGMRRAVVLLESILRDDVKSELVADLSFGAALKEERLKSKKLEDSIAALESTIKTLKSTKEEKSLATKLAELELTNEQLASTVQKYTDGWKDMQGRLDNSEAELKRLKEVTEEAIIVDKEVSIS